MPELPEVETTRRGLIKHLIDQKVTAVIARHTQLRWPIPKNLHRILLKQQLIDISRRGKYLLFAFHSGTLLIHLGMSGHLHLLNGEHQPKKHDHLDILFGDYTLRYTDPRRFGAICWITESPRNHPLIASLGPEPLTKAFSGHYLYDKTRRRTQAIKSCVMNNEIVVGVGNIYATESLFQAKIHPLLPARELTEKQCNTLVNAIKAILKKAIKAGGTTLKDFMNSEGKPGYFSQQLLVYGQNGSLCKRCRGATLQLIKISGRATVFCPRCQAL